jgi:glycosyltransferase involved in cell wall biosynthesis
MKVLIAAPYYYPYTSGMTVYVQRLSEALIKRGHEVTVLTNQHQKNLSRKENINGVNVLRVPVTFGYKRGSFAPSYLLKFYAQARGHDKINIHTPFFESGLISLISYVLGKRPILTYHCDLSLKGGLISRLVNASYYLSLGLAARASKTIVVNSIDYARASKIKDFIEKTKQVTPPIDTEKIHRTTVTKSFREKFRLKPSDRVIGFLGRLVWEKGLVFLLQALPEVQKEIPEVKLLIAGEGEKIAGGPQESEKNRLLSLAEELKLHNIVFTGHLTDDELLEFYSVCDVFVLPSIDPLESFGMVKIEAALCQVPVIVSDLPGLKEMINAPKSALIVPPSDSGELAKAITRVLKNKDDFSVDRQDLERSFGVDKTAEAYEQVFTKGT